MRRDIQALAVQQTYCVNVIGKVCGATFYDDACFRYYLVHLLHCLNVFHVSLHAYCLLPNRIFLLITPDTPFGLPNLIAKCNTIYADYFRNRFSRGGVILARQPDKCLLLNVDQVLACQRAIERLPLQLNPVDHPGSYQWSSYCANAFGRERGFLKAHPQFQEFLNATRYPFKRYREFIAMSLVAGCPSNHSPNGRYFDLEGIDLPISWDFALK